MFSMVRILINIVITAIVFIPPSTAVQLPATADVGFVFIGKMMARCGGCWVDKGETEWLYQISHNIMDMNFRGGGVVHSQLLLYIVEGY